MFDVIWWCSLWSSVLWWRQTSCGDHHTCSSTQKFSKKRDRLSQGYCTQLLPGADRPVCWTYFMTLRATVLESFDKIFGRQSSSQSDCILSSLRRSLESIFYQISSNLQCLSLACCSVWVSYLRNFVCDIFSRPSQQTSCDSGMFIILFRYGLEVVAWFILIMFVFMGGIRMRVLIRMFVIGGISPKHLELLICKYYVAMHMTVSVFLYI